MFKLEKTLVVFAISFMLLFAIGAVIQPAKAQFVLSSWSYPDEHGQGIYGFFIDENSTGVFLPVGGPIISPSNACVFIFDSGFALGLDMRVTVNYTFLGLDYPTDVVLGLNYIRLNVTVTTPAGTVFSQNNFTYDGLNGAVSAGIWYYSQEVEFDFILVAGDLYTAIVTYEVFY